MNSEQQPAEQQFADFGVRYFKRDFVDRNAERPVTWRRFDRAIAKLLKTVMDVVGESVGEQLKKVTDRFDRTDARIATLEAAIEELKARPPGLDYRGVWRGGEYKRGMAATFGGSLFIAQTDTDRRPGTADSGWILAVKRGRDLRE